MALRPRYGLRAARVVVSEGVVIVPGVRSRSAVVVVPTLGMGVAGSMSAVCSTQGDGGHRDDQRPDGQHNSQVP